MLGETSPPSIRGPSLASLMAVTKLLSAPLRALAALITASIAGRLFELLWKTVTRGRPIPDGSDKAASTLALIAAAALESASKAATREVVDRAGRKTSTHFFGTGGGRATTVPPAHPKAARRAEEEQAKNKTSKRSRKSRKSSQD